MIPTEFTTFFATSAAAGATLVGLIFLAISLAPGQILAPKAAPERQVAAASAFGALTDAFFISLGAVIPHWNAGWVALIMGILGLASNAVQSFALLRAQRQRTVIIQRSALIAVAALLFFGQIVFAVRLLIMPTDALALNALIILLLAVYFFGLIRAWQLLGARGAGIFSLFGSLRQLNEQAPLVTDDDEQ